MTHIFSAALRPVTALKPAGCLHTPVLVVTRDYRQQ